MKNLLQTALILSVLLLTGCAATVEKSDNGSAITTATINANKVVVTVQGGSEVTANKDWVDFRTQWNTSMTEAAAKAGLSYTYSPTPVAPAGDNGALVVINVKDYRYITTTARILAGIMTGNAWLDVDVDYRNLDSGNLVGTKNYQTKSSAWGGVFSPMTEKQIDAICAEIIDEIKKHKESVKVSSAK